MKPDALRFLAERLKVAYFAKDTEVLGPSSGVVDRLYIVKKGAVTGNPPEALSGTPGEVGLALGPGECFPIGALVGRRATQYSYRTGEDTFFYELGAEAFHALLGMSPQFHSFCTSYLASLVNRSHQELRSLANEGLAEVHSMLEPLAGLVSRAAVSCEPHATLREVLGKMSGLRIGSMVVVDGDAAPIGILTHPDVLERVALAGADLSARIDSVMTPAPFALPIDAPVFEAALAMAKHGIRHVVLLKDGRLAGVVSERDLFALQRVSLRRTAERIRGGDSVEALRDAAAGTRDLVRNLLAQGFGAEQITQVVSTLNDSLTQRLIGIVERRHQLPGRWCWVALGSEGRSEQTLSTDQDNALIIDPAAGAAPDRAAFLAFADEVNQGLDTCGFPLCKGGIMARNPMWCLTLGEWRGAFSGWIRNTDPKALLNAAIFFDFRALYGDGGLAGELREAVLEQAAGTPAFLRGMTGNALQVKPPIGLFRDFVTDDSAEFPNTIDLKKFGTRPFVDVARIHALGRRIPDTGTVARLRAAGEAGALPAQEASAAIEAFQFIQTLRVRHQYLKPLPRPGTENRIAPDSINALDRRILKEAFRQAGSLQDRIRLDYQL
ncbi:MAG: CBS domain-containing protein [Proteobacteria bacterium]|nr:CBS domain-containing protein [Pseudomonadota bacterium]